MNLTTVVSGGVFSRVFRLRPHRVPFLFLILFLTTADVFSAPDREKSFHLQSVAAEAAFREPAINCMIKEADAFLWLGTSLLILLGGIACRIRIAELKKNQSELQKHLDTLRRETKEARRIHETDESKLKLYTNIFHEFGTLLTLIAGPVSHLIKHNRTAGTAERLKLLKMVARNTDRLLQLVNQFPDISKPAEAGTIPEEEDCRAGAASAIENNNISTASGESYNGPSIIGEPIPENKVKILVIGDNAEVRAFIRASLRFACSVTEAGDASEGLELAIATVPEIIVCEIMMPTMNGLDLCRILKTNEATSHIPVILLTATATEYHRMEGYRHGADSCITRPFTIETLQARINNLITARKKLRNLYLGNAFLEPDDTIRPNPEIGFLRKCFAFISKNLDNPELDSVDFCKHMAMSQPQLYRRLMAVTGMPISDFIQSYRLRKAALLLKSGKYTIAEIAYQVGFKDPSYFSKCFARHYGSTPSQYVKVAGASKSAPTI